MIGVDPGEKTLRELWWMARGAWDMTSEITSTMAQLWSGEDAEPYTRNMFHPMRRAGKRLRNVMPYNPAVLEGLSQSGIPTGSS